MWSALIQAGFKEELIINSSFWIPNREDLGNVWILPLTDYYCMVLSPKKSYFIDYYERDCKTTDDIIALAQALKPQNGFDFNQWVQFIKRWKESRQIGWRKEAMKGFKTRLRSDIFSRFNRLER